MHRSTELLKRTRYHKPSNLKSRSLIYDNITKSRDYYFGWSKKELGTLQPTKFPWKPIFYRNRVYCRNMYSPNNSYLNKPGIPKKFTEKLSLDENLMKHGVLNEEDFEKLSISEFTNTKLMGYAPYHAFKHPDRTLAGYESIKHLVIKDYENNTGEKLPEKYRKQLNHMLSYEYASKEKKQEVHFNDVMYIISTKVKNLRPSDLMPGAPIPRLAYQTTRIRNLMEDAQELFSIKRHETLRHEKDAYDKKRFEIKELLQIRSKTLAEIRRLNIDHYFDLMQILNLELVDPPRRTLDKDFNEHHAQKRAMSRLYKYASVDPRIGDRQTSLEPIKSKSNTIDYFDHHVVSHLNKHTAQIIDMRIRTFAHMESLAREKVKRDRKMGENIDKFQKDIKNDLRQGGSEEEVRKWEAIGFFDDIQEETK